MTTERLYNRPPQTLNTLENLLAGATTVDELSDEMGYSENAIYNRLHDPRILGIIEKADGEYKTKEEARRIIQLKDKDPLKDPFLELPGVERVQDRLMNNSEVSFEQIGRDIAFETGSNATDEESFLNYGRVYANWFDYLELGYYGNGTLYADEANVESGNEDPLQPEKGANSPACRPKKIFEMLDIVGGISSLEELFEEMDYERSTVENLISTSYALDLVEKTPTSELIITDTGKELRTSSQGNREKILRDQLLSLPFVKAFCNRIPEGEFSVHDVIHQISEDYNKGWSENTIHTKGKRIYRWLIYTDLAQEVKKGTLKRTDVVERRKISDP